MARKPKQTLDYDTYASERRELYKYQQSAYDSYEKTLTALTGSTLALSVAFLGFLQSSRPPSTPLIVSGSQFWLYVSWSALTIGLISLSLCFFLNARAFTVEMHILDRALEDASALNQKNWWTSASVVLYAVSAVLFFGGVISLLYFCHLNLLR